MEISFLIWLLVVLIIGALVIYAVRLLLPRLGIGEPFDTLIVVLLIVILIFIIARRAGVI